MREGIPPRKQLQWLKHKSNFDLCVLYVPPTNASAHSCFTVRDSLSFVINPYAKGSELEVTGVLRRMVREGQRWIFLLIFVSHILLFHNRAPPIVNATPGKCCLRRFKYNGKHLVLGYSGLSLRIDTTSVFVEELVQEQTFFFMRIMRDDYYGVLVSA